MPKKIGAKCSFLFVSKLVPYARMKQSRLSALDLQIRLEDVSSLEISNMLKGAFSCFSLVVKSGTCRK